MLTDEDLEAIVIGGLFLFGVVLTTAGMVALFGFWWTVTLFGLGILYLCITLSNDD